MNAPVVLRMSKKEKKKKTVRHEKHSVLLLINIHFHCSSEEKILIYDYYDYCEDGS